jgi:GNAT superfamily N-acetyltransferase
LSAAPYELRVEDDPRPEDVAVLSEGLTRHALPATRVPGFRRVAVFARDPSPAIVGGVFGTINWSWLHVSLIWVAEPLRHTGLGTRLIGEIERVAAARGCAHAHLDTFSYQARPFYERLGYRVFGVLDDYPPGHQRFFMRKDF